MQHHKFICTIKNVSETIIFGNDNKEIEGYYPSLEEATKDFNNWISGFVGWEISNIRRED